jgi:hypothetical protein
MRKVWIRGLLVWIAAGRLLWATRPAGKDVKAADGENGLLAALRASPVANFCKDTGDFYSTHW